MDEEQLRAVLEVALLNTATRSSIARDEIQMLHWENQMLERENQMLQRECLKLKKIEEEKINYQQQLTDLKDKLQEKRDLLILQRTKGRDSKSDVAVKTQDESVTLMLQHRTRIQEIEDEFSNLDE
ncbi:hypothetical protein ACHQM5_013351 [Ranunculus cassubicifolius]